MVDSFLLVKFLVLFSASATAFKIQPRIFGGNEATAAGQFQYIVSLRTFKQMRSYVDYFNFCGGGLISDRWIVSAAHCFYDESSKVENIVATVAAHGWKHDGEVYKILQRVNHPKFSRDSGNKEYDLALLQTVQPIAFHEKVQPIPISKQWIPEGDKGMFAGWGLSNNGRHPFFLRYIEMEIISNDECRTIHKEHWRKYVYNTTICTLVDYGTGSCRGDSGGPLVLNNQLIGVLSWGVPCALGRPEGFTRISSFTKWIESVSGVKAV